MESQPTASADDARTLDLVGGQSLVVQPQPDGNLLRIMAPDGSVRLSIHVTPAGPVLRFEGAGVLIQAEGLLAVDAAQVAIHGREGLSLSTGGDLTIAATGDLETRARVQTITAELGDVKVKANDDVRINGERVMVNC